MPRLATLLLLANLLSGAVVIDRIAAVVNKRAVKLSDIQRDLRLTEFMNQQPLDMSPSQMKKAADRLIDQAIIRDEVASGGYHRPSESEADTLIKHLVHDRFGGSDARLREALARYHITEHELGAQYLFQVAVLRFIDQRFRPGVQVTDDDVQTYYYQHLAELKRKYPGDFTLAALQNGIRSLIEGEHVNQLFTTWLDEARKKAHIVYEEGGFQ
jgi:hypothetical protein